MDYIQKNLIKAMVISVDAEKAFDSVNWNFLSRVLHKFGFHYTIIKTIQAIYDILPIGLKSMDICQIVLPWNGAPDRVGCAWSPLLFALYLEPLVQHIRQHEDIKGITMKGTEYKLACYADDILVYLGNPTHTLPKLMQSFERFSQLSGYKINISKTQLLSYNYNPPEEIKHSYPLAWQTETFRYLGINLPKDLTQLFEQNYLPIHKKNKR